MTLSIRLLAISAIVALAPAAYAGGLDDAVEDDEVIIPVVVPFSLGGLGGGAAIVVGAILVGALVASSGSDSGSH